VKRGHRTLATIVVAGGGLALGLAAASSWNPSVDPVVVAADLVVGWVFIGGGTLVWARRPRAGAVGGLMAAVGVAWFAGTIWPAFEFLHRGPLLHLLVTYPAGHLARRRGIAAQMRVIAVLAAYAANVTRLGGDALVATTYGVILAALAAAALAGTRGTMRRARLAGAVAALGIATAVLAGALARLAGSPLGVMGLYAYEAALVVGGVLMVLDLLFSGFAHAVARAVVDLGDAALAGSVRDRLGRSLGDPSLVLAFAREGQPGHFVDELGQPVTFPPASPDRAIMPMVAAGRETGFIAADATLLDDARLVESLSAAAGLAMANSRCRPRFARASPKWTHHASGWCTPRTRSDDVSSAASNREPPAVSSVLPRSWAGWSHRDRPCGRAEPRCEKSSCAPGASSPTSRAASTPPR